MDLKRVKYFLSLILFLTVSFSSFSSEPPKMIRILEDFRKYTTIDESIWSDSNIEQVLIYEGSDIPSAKMYLYDNGILILQSKFYSATLTEESLRFFRYLLSASAIYLISIDERQDVNGWLSVEEYYEEHTPEKIIVVDRRRKTVGYYASTNGFYFGGFLFYPSSE